MAQAFSTPSCIQRKDPPVTHLIAELLHDLDIEGLEAVAVGADEVEAAVDAVVDDVLAVQPALVAQVPVRNK